MLKQPQLLVCDDGLSNADRNLVSRLNASTSQLGQVHAAEITVSGPFARSKIAWKLARHQHALLHRIVALLDGITAAWNHRSTLSAMILSRALMETIAIMMAFEERVAHGSTPQTYLS